MRKINIILLLIIIFSAISLQAQELKVAKLKNGLTVYIWEDSTATKTFGQISVKAGSIDDPADYTGLAHYLEHLLFKGTDKISTLDWTKEQPIYSQIIAKYDEMAEETDPVKKEAINKDINKLTIEASTYSKSNEFSALVESFGGSNLNAGTSYDYTVYYNYFPTSELEKWLELYSARLINPVFRAFQTELETVYEEYNRANDNPNQGVSKFLSNNIFAGTPYATPIIGKGEHLKNPRISKVIDFYNSWYVPENMALILVGNIKTEEVLPSIARKFARLKANPVGERANITYNKVKGKVKASAKVGRMPITFIAYEGESYNNDDYIALEICSKILYNSSGSGLLNKLGTDGELMHASASIMPTRDAGKIIIQGIPSYDAAQRRFGSHNSTEKQLLSVIDNLKKGNIEDWLIGSVKTEMCKEHDLTMENQSSKAGLISRSFVYDVDISSIIDYKAKVLGVTIEDIKRVAKEYFGEDYWSLSVEQGQAKKEEKMNKPAFDPINSPEGKSTYTQWFGTISPAEVKIQYPDINSTQSKKVNDFSNIFYTKNNENEVFSLVIKYGVGETEIPKLGMATSLMNNAGIMAQLKSHEFKEELSKYGASTSYSSNDDYLYITLTGIDLYLKEACNLLTRQILMPELDERQLNNTIGGTIQNRILQRKDANSISSALLEYVKYKEKSDFLDRMTTEEVRGVSISNLVGEFQKATNYAAEIYYTGTLPFNEAYDILSKNLPLKEGEVQSNSPKVKDRQRYSANTIFFTPNTDAEQSQIHFYIEGEPYTLNESVIVKFFNQYFNGGFGSVVMNEIREKKSLAYQTYGAISTPPIANKNFYFYGFIGTQGDKTIEAIELYLSILNDIPEYKGREDNVKNYLVELYNTSKPTFRSEAMVFREWKRLGYTEAPAKVEVSQIKEMDFEKLQAFHSKYIKGKPIVIAVSGNPKNIDLKVLEKFGKVERVSVDKLFSKD